MHEAAPEQPRRSQTTLLALVPQLQLKYYIYSLLLLMGLNLLLTN